MMDAIYWQALALGALEAATEFLPVSSTGHLILAGHVMGFEGPGGKVFEVAIQLGAILAICVLYFRKLWAVMLGLPGLPGGDPHARRFTANILLAFLPAAVVGVLLHDFIKTVLFSPTVVCWALVAGGFAIIAIEALVKKATLHRVEDMRPHKALQLGFFQCLAMVPGVSRSGATIMGGLLLGMDRKAAAEFSFFLAIPTMLGATVFDLFKARHDLADGSLGLIAVGFVTAFVVALPVVKWLVGFVSRNGFTPFAYYRIVLGLVGLLLLG